MPRKMGKKLYKKRKTQRGGDSAAYGFGSAVAPGAPYAQEVVAKEACGAVTRPGTLVGYSAGSGGLPGLTGFAGGGTRYAKKSKKFSFKRLAKSFKNFFKSKHMKKRAKSATKKQRGGRWTADTAAAYASGPNVFLPVTRIGCEGGLVNTSPPGAQNPTMAFKQMGGAGTLASPYYSAQTAGYGFAPSTYVSAVGSPVKVEVPYDAGRLNPACLKTGGGNDEEENNGGNMEGGARRRRSKSKSKARRRR
jgi:hypothetical protein